MADERETRTARQVVALAVDFHRTASGVGVDDMPGDFVATALAAAATGQWDVDSDPEPIAKSLVPLLRVWLNAARFETYLPLESFLQTRAALSRTDVEYILQAYPGLQGPSSPGTREPSARG